MNAKIEAISKIQNLTESLAKEVSDFIDFLKLRKDKKKWEQWNLFQESQQLSEGDFSYYLTNLENYEEMLAKGKIKW